MSPTTSSQAERTGPAGIDPRGPRFSAGITAVLLIVVVVLGVAGAALSAFALLLAIALLFAWGAFAGVGRHPYGWLFRKLVRPRLTAPTELEDPRPPTFAQLVGLLVTGVGVVLALFGLPVAVVIAAAAAFIAAFLNSVFGYCLGCQLYLLLLRVRATV